MNGFVAMLLGFQLLLPVSLKVIVMASELGTESAASVVGMTDAMRPKLLSVSASSSGVDVVTNVDVVAGGGCIFFFFSGLRRIGSRTMLLSFSGGTSSVFSSEKKLIVCNERKRVLGLDLCTATCAREGDDDAFVVGDALVVVASARPSDSAAVLGAAATVVGAERGTDSRRSRDGGESGR